MKSVCFVPCLSQISLFVIRCWTTRMKKEKNPVSTAPPLAQTKTANSLVSAVNNLVKEGAESSPPPPTIKTDPDGGPPPPAQSAQPAVNGDNASGCDKTSPPPPAPTAASTGGEGEAAEDKKPVIAANDVGPGVVKSETSTDSFLDSFDTKDGGEWLQVIR